MTNHLPLTTILAFIARATDTKVADHEVIEEGYIEVYDADDFILATIRGDILTGYIEYSSSDLADCPLSSFRI